MGIEIKEELLDIEGIKNSNKPLLDLFIRRTAVVTSTREDLVEKIIRDQWRNASKKTQLGTDISEFDFCNLGTFFISQSKAKKRLEKITKINEAIINKLKDPNEKVQKKWEPYKKRNLEMIKSIKMKTKQLYED